MIHSTFLTFAFHLQLLVQLDCLFFPAKKYFITLKCFLNSEAKLMIRLLSEAATPLVSSPYVLKTGTGQNVHSSTEWHAFNPVHDVTAIHRIYKRKRSKLLPNSKTSLID